MNNREINPADRESEISVIIAARNAASTLRRALDCVAAQDLAPEIIFVDDASDDETASHAEQWAVAHPAIPFRMLQLDRRTYALRARIAGLSLVRSHNVIFLDADDTWAGTHRLRNVLTRKNELDCEVLHFRSTGFLDGINVGELLWTAPPPMKQLKGKEIFSAYAAMEYPSLQLWNKVYSLKLLEKAATYIGNSEIFYFDDKFFVSLILMLADSWASANEYIYQYWMNPAWPLEKIAKCAHDLLVIREKALELFPILGIDAQTRKNYLEFLDRRLVLHLGRLSIEIEKRLFEGICIRDAIAPIHPWLSITRVLPALVNATDANVKRIIQISKRIHEHY